MYVGGRESTPSLHVSDGEAISSELRPKPQSGGWLGATLAPELKPAGLSVMPARKGGLV